jgi:hypothetical protein
MEARAGRKESTVRRKQFVLAAILAGIGTAFALRGGDAPAPGGAKRPPAAALRFGVFDSRAIAVAFVHSRFSTGPKDLMDERKKAEETGDQKRIEELKAKGKKLQDKLHLQGFGKVPVDDLLAYVKDGIPQVAKSAGVDAIADDVLFTAPGVETVDVTDALVKLYSPNESTLKMVESLKKTRPLPLDRFPVGD